jgi:hypothetical protein
VKQIRFSMTAESSRRKAVQKAKDWIDKNPLQPKFPAIDPEQPAFIRVPVKAISVITAALEAVGMKKEANEVEAFARDYTDPEANANRESWLAEANGMARDGEIEFDSDSTISHSEGGEYVLGWVWVKGDEEEDEDEENDE